VLTEAERQAIRERFAAGKAKAALARGEVAIPGPGIEVKPIRVVEVKPEANHKSGSVKPSSKLVVKPAPKPMPVKGRKVEAKPSAQ
jgi:hypothetical protein